MKKLIVKPIKAQRAAVGMSRNKANPKMKLEHLLQLTTSPIVNERYFGRRETK